MVWEKNISPSEVIYIGNDENDVECLKSVDVVLFPLMHMIQQKSF